MTRRRRRTAKSRKVLFIHSARRAAERYGIVLTPEIHDRMKADITAGRARIIERQSNRVSVYEVQAGGQTCTVCYDRYRKAIITFLPKEEQQP